MRVGVEAVLALATQAAQVVLVAVEMVALTQVLMEHLAQQTRVVALAVIGLAQVPQAMVALVSLFLLYQQPNTQAQPQAHQLSRQAVQTQF
jgi:hypothetical protein